MTMTKSDLDSIAKAVADELERRAEAVCRECCPECGGTATATKTDGVPWPKCDNPACEGAKAPPEVSP
jgi:hypothetical protein